MVRSEYGGSRVSRRAALRAGTALGTAAVLASTPGSASGQTPGPEALYQRSFIGNAISLPASADVIRRAELETLMLNAGITRRGVLRDVELLARATRLGRDDKELLIATLARIVERARGPVQVQFLIRDYVDQPAGPEFEDRIVTIRLRSDPVDGREASIQYVIIDFT